MVRAPFVLSALAGLPLGWAAVLEPRQQPTPAITSMTSSSSASTSSSTVINSFTAGIPIKPTVQQPNATDSQLACPGYTASNVNMTQHGMTASLALAGPACNSYGTDIDALDLIVEYQAKDRLHVEIVPTYLDNVNSTYYLPPAEVVKKPTVDESTDGTLAFHDLEFSYGNDPSFWFKVTRRSTGDELFSTQGSKIVFQNQFVELKTTLPEEYNLYGLGETIAPFRLGNNYTKTMWAVDQADAPNANMYGTFPVYYETRYYEQNSTTGNMTYVPLNKTSLTGNYTSLSHSVYYRNPGHGQDILLNATDLTWRTIGGEIDLYFYSGPTVEKAVKSVTNSAFGLPAMQQYYTFGYHQCRWGYHNWSEVEDVVNNMTAFQIPLESMWNDIDYLDVFRDFTTDPTSFPMDVGSAFLDRLHAGGRHYIPIFDSPVYIPNPNNKSDIYPSYDRGHEANAFMLQYNSTDEYIGRFWPGFVVFPDWYQPSAGEWWANEIALFHQNLSFDGIWIDLSEVASQCVGSCGSSLLSYNPAPDLVSNPTTYMFPLGFNVSNSSEASYYSSINAAASTSSSSASSSTSYVSTLPTAGAPRNVNYPPYAINNIEGDLAVSVMSPNATSHNGLLSYDVHNLWGNQIGNATYYGLLQTFPNKRPFIIGRSTSIGAGTKIGHWGGDNYSAWFSMLRSISQAFEFSLFGVPMFGVDTCGFNDDTDEELCNRWMQLSAFFTFYRNHNIYGAISQEPYRWASVAEATKKAMDIRYALLPYMYTLFHSSHTTGSTVLRAMAWEFPSLPELAGADQQLMLGPSILVTPVLEPGYTTVNGVFPGARTGTVWYDWYNQTAISDAGALRGENVTIDAPLGHIPVYVRGGSVLPLQPRGDKLVTRDMRTQPWAVLAALDSAGRASGSLYLDDGESVTVNATRTVALDARNSALRATAVGAWKEKPALANVTVLGVATDVKQVLFNNRSVPTWTYDSGSKVLAVTGLANVTSSGAWSGPWSLTWS